MRARIALTGLITFVLTLVVETADTAPIQVCYQNSASVTVNFGIFLPYKNGESHTTLAPGATIREEGDGDGPYCVSASYAGDPRECPVERDDTDSGLQLNLNVHSNRFDAEAAKSVKTSPVSKEASHEVNFVRNRSCTYDDVDPGYVQCRRAKVDSRSNALLVSDPNRSSAKNRRHS